MKKAIKLLINVLLLLACAIVLFTCSDPANTNPNSTPHSISGIVSGATQSGITIALSGDSTATTTTDASGKYRFDGLADQTYAVAPSKEGYLFEPAVRTFGGWCNSDNICGDITDANFTASNASLTYYTVTYSGNGNTGGYVPIDTINYVQGHVVTVLGNTGNLVKTGYSFAGWNTQSDGSGTTYTQGQTFTMSSANVTLYAKWIRVVPVPDTGQSTCYDSSGAMIACVGTGQDGAYTIHTMSYTDNGNGTIADNVTKLLWQKCSMGLSGTNCDFGTAVKDTWAEAGTACSNLNLAGTGWRLPTEYELGTLFNFGTPAINGTYFPNTKQDYYWSSTTTAFSTTAAWSEVFSFGFTFSNPKTNTFYVRCVRGQENASHFIDNGNGTVTDLTTNLMWQQCPAGLSGTTCAMGTAGVYTWDWAMTYCEGLSLGGFTDWRLPNIKELQSILDMTSVAPVITSTYFPNTLRSDYWSYYWSSTTAAFSTASAWSVSFGGGSTYNFNKTNTYNARCVRGQ